MAIMVTRSMELGENKVSPRDKDPLISLLTHMTERISALEKKVEYLDQNKKISETNITL